MISFYENYFENILELHNDIRDVLIEIPQHALDWTPSPEMNSLNVLVVHICGAERYWIGDVIANDTSGRDREAEFKSKGSSAEELIQQLNENDKYLKNVLERLDLEELNKKRISPRNGREVSVGWALSHALKHTALHAGHIQIMRQLWEEQMAS
jgi:uncharacterized damage-inducible protein DinB